MTNSSGTVRKRSVTVAGHPTSVSLEEPFWEALGDMARARGLTVGSLIAEIDAEREGGGLSSAIRLKVLAHYRALAEPAEPPPGSTVRSGRGGGRVTG